MKQNKWTIKSISTKLLVATVLWVSIFKANAGGKIPVVISQPDLVVTSITQSPLKPDVGNQVAFSATIKNRGTAATKAGRVIGIKFMVDGKAVSISKTYDSSIPAGGSVKLTGDMPPLGLTTRTWTASLGDHQSEAIVDHYDNISESNEANNTLAANLSVVGLPDLVVSNLSQTPSTVVAGQSVVFSATITNQGTGPTPAGAIIGVGFRVDGTATSFATTSNVLAAGASVTLTATSGPDGNNFWRATSGTHSVRAFADDVNRFAESNEDNNVLESTFVVAPAVAGVPAVAADSFVESIGVVTHLSWGGTVWDIKSNEWVPLFGELGVRSTRTAMGSSALAKNLLTRLNTQYGVRTVASFNSRKADNTLDSAKIDGNLAFLRDQVGLDKIIAIEGANEYNDTKPAGNLEWASQLRTHTQMLYTKVRADSRFSQIPVLGPTIWKNLLADYRELGNLDGYADYATIHYYTGGRKPTLNGANGTLNTMDELMGWSENLFTNLPIYVTETGYNTMTDNVDSPYATPENVQAKYSLRLFAEYFKRNRTISRAFLYNFMDNPAVPDKVYGLVAQPIYPETQLRRKPAFYAIKNAIKIMKDPGPAFQPGELIHTISGDKTDISSVVSQKRDGRFYLMIWLDVDSIDRTATPPRVLNPAPRQLSLDVSQHHFSSAKIYLPTAFNSPNPDIGALPTSTISNPTVINLAVPDQVMIVELIP